MVIGGIVVVVIILAGGWWYWSSSNSTPATPSSSDNMTPEEMAQMGNEPQSQGTGAQTAQPQGGQVPTQGQPEPQPNVEPVPVSSGASDSDLSQDASQIDAQMNGLNSDNASADNSLSSQ